MIKEFIKGFTSYFRAISFISKHRLYYYFLISGFISLAIAAVIGGLIFFIAPLLSALITPFIPAFIASSTVGNIITIVFGAFMLLLGFMIFKYLLLIFVGPFMSPLSEKVENILDEEKGFTKTNKPLLKGIKDIPYGLWRGTRLSIRNATREVLITLFLLLLGLIPLLTIFIVPLIFFVQSYFLGFGNMDYYLERYTNVKGSIRNVRQHRGLAIGNGAAFLLLLMVPILGLFVAPVLGTVSASMNLHESNIGKDSSPI